MTVHPQQLVLTGPTGWIGSAFLEELARVGGDGWHKRVTLFGSSARTITSPSGPALSVRSLQEISPADVRDAHLVHLAYLTKDKVAPLGPSAFFAANMAIDDALLAACELGRPRAVFVASSGAARQAETGREREPYGLCKLMQEDRFLAFSERTGIPVLAARIFNLAGPHINKLESYALSALLTQAFRDGATRIKAHTPVYRAYLHVGDLCALALGALGEGCGSTAPLDFGGTLTVEMEDVAREALRAAGCPGGSIMRPPVDWDRPNVYLGDSTSARTLALRLGLSLRTFSEQVNDTATNLLNRGAFAVDPNATKAIEPLLPL